MKENKSLIVFWVIAAVLAGMLISYAMFPRTIEVVKNVPVEKIVYQDKIVTTQVDSPNLALLENYIYDNKGNLSALEVNDLDEDEISLLITRINFINEIKAKAIAEVTTNIFDEADKTVVNGTKLDDSDLEKLRINDESKDILVQVKDFDDLDAVATVTGTFKQDEVKYKFTSKVEFESNEVEDFSVLIELA